MDFSEDGSNLKKTSKKSKVAALLLLILVLAGVSFFIYLKSQGINIKNIDIKTFINNSMAVKDTSQQVFEIKYDTKERSVFNVYKGLIIQCTRDSIKAINKKGEEEWSHPVSMNNPIIKRTGSNLLVADIGGRDFYVLNGKNIKWSKKTDENIINADISEDGYVSVVQDAKGYKGAVTVFNLQGNEFFTRTIADSFVLSAMVAPTGDSVIINSIDASGVKATTNLEYTDMFGKPFAAKTIETNMLFPSFWHLNNGNLVAISDSAIICLDKERKEKWRQEYKNGEIFSSSIAQGKYTVVAAYGEDKSGDSKNNIMQIAIFNTNGKQVSGCTIEDSIINIESYRDIIAVNTGKKVYFINTNGKQVGQYNSSVGIVGVYFFDRNEAAIVTKNSVVIAKTN